MGVARLARMTLFVPSVELQDAIREVSNFAWFHPIQDESAPYYDRELSDLALRAYRIHVEIGELIKGLEVQEEPSFVETFLKGYETVRTKRTAKDWSDFVGGLEREAVPITKEVQALLENGRNLEKELSEKSSLRAAIHLVSRFRVDVKALGRQKRFHSTFAIMPSKTVEELKRSLPDGVVVDETITRNESAVLVVSFRSDSEKVEKVLRTLEVKPFSIPGNLPQNPMEAYSILTNEMAGLEGKLKRVEASIESARERLGTNLLSLREAAGTAYSVLDRVKRKGKLKRFHTIKGYIPLERSEEFQDRWSSRWITFAEEISYHGHSHGGGEEHPVLLTNRGPHKAFESITLNQGPPRYGEIDPTPIITFFFPAFYGIMFGDFGHGMILLAIGLLMRLRGKGGIRDWGIIMVVAGMVASIVGLIIGEAFGEDIKHLLPFLREMEYHPLVELVERAHGTAGFNSHSILTILKFTLLVGILHITLGYILDIVKARRMGKKVELYIAKIPTLTFYLSFVLFGLSVLTNPVAVLNPFQLLESKAFLPVFKLFVKVPVSLAVSISLPILLASVAIVIAGKPVAILAGKAEKESIGMALFMSLVEVLERIASFLANTISYTRLAILLFVHAALLLALGVAVTLPPLDLFALPLLVVGNAGIIGLEALIVYIQDLRLHLYEWFSKFYEGTGVLFSKIMPETSYIEIAWEHKAGG